MSNSFFFFFFFSVLALPCLTVTFAASCHPDDEAGLLGFKSGITQDPSGILSSWKKGTECCKWNGISCLDEKRVNSISLSVQPNNPKSFLSGSISPSLSKVRNLDGIYFSNLGLSGKFPDVFFQLPALKFVYIENNSLSGNLPANIGKLVQLEALGLSGNRFTGQIPSSISNLTRLTQLKLDGNQFSGVIPPGIARLKSLSYLTLKKNQLSGTVPDIFNSFSDLRILELSHNKFSGKIPGSIASLAPKLMYLELGHNQLTGTIPNFLGNFRSLDTLDLSSNRFTGTVPKSFRNLTKIFNLDLSRNLLVDPFPELNVKGIESLDLSYNQFHLREIPKWVTSSPIIYSLKLAKCGIKISLDTWKPAETYFYDYVDLSENEITGSPISLLNKTEYLVGFSASGNKLKFDLGKIKIGNKMKYMDLSRNLVFGKVPKTVSGLEKLNVSYNHLCGQIPPTKFPASAFIGNDCLCGSPLSPCKA